MRKGLRIGSIVVHVADVPRATAFWAPARDYVPRHEAEPDWVILQPREGEGPNLSLDGVGADPPRFPDIHLDLYARDQSAEVDRLIALGARRVEDWPYPDEPIDYVVLQDPDGNRFCVVDASQD